MQRVFLEGITVDELITLIQEVVRKEIQQVDETKYRPISKAEACRQLGGIHFNTLIKLMSREGKTKDDIICNKGIEIWKLKYPKYSRE